ncbi:MAG TPA: disulfide bond formation protein B [Gammaproteobacteria bacterium]|nr:disulfide bond formation protein B [Gammaproteobacteria bacterium]
MSVHSSRIALVTALMCAMLLSVALYLEFVSGLVPCALCLAQRVMFGLIGIGCLLYLLPFYGSRLIFGLLSFVSSGLGVWLASRQLWLQSLPEDQVPACGPDIYFILERLPIFDSLKAMFFGSGNCAEVQWIFLNLSIPGWTLLFYVFTASTSMWLIIFRGPRPFRLFKS